jgi:1,4-dihydroxy-2-naphthoate octaprenyltransferase
MSPFQLLLGLGLVSALAIASGLWLVALTSWGLLAFGLAALLAVFAYSGGPWPLASHALGEVMVLMFFGWLAVGGSYYVHTLQINPVVMGYGTVAGLISAAIMLVNNIRDIATDRPANKHTLAVVLGDNRARQLYVGLLITAVVGHLVISFPLGLVSLIPVLMMTPFLRRLVGAIRVRKGAGLNLQLAQTAQLVLLYCLAMSAVLVVF